MDSETKLCAQKDFLARFSFTSAQFAESKLDWKELCAIHEAHVASNGELQTAAVGILDRLRQVPQIHSVKLRIKNPERLVAKIIRKKLEKPEANITRENYSTEITDLIGIRALHLFKDDWLPIDEFVQQNWPTRETPKAYVREGDSHLEPFTQRKFDVEKHAFGYRSVHYLLETRPTKKTYVGELQVRTLFEEAWSEIDHRMRYPNQSTDTHLDEFLRIFNRLAGSADEMGTFIKNLSQSLAERAELLEAAQKKAEEKETELKRAISKLNISENDRNKLEKQVDELRQQSPAYSDPLRGATSGITLYGGSTLAGIGFPTQMCRTCGRSAGLTDMFISGECVSCSTRPKLTLSRVCRKCFSPFSDSLTSITTSSDLCPSCRRASLTGF